MKKQPIKEYVNKIKSTALRYESDVERVWKRNKIIGSRLQKEENKKRRK